SCIPSEAQEDATSGQLRICDSPASDRYPCGLCRDHEHRARDIPQRLSRLLRVLRARTSGSHDRGLEIRGGIRVPETAVAPPGSEYSAGEPRIDCAGPSLRLQTGGVFASLSEGSGSMARS